VLAILLVTAVALCGIGADRADKERPGGPEGLRAFRLQLRVESERAGEYTEHVQFKPPRNLHITRHLLPNTTQVFTFDGTVGWSYSILHGKVDEEIWKWDLGNVEEKARKGGQAAVFQAGLSGLFAIVDLTRPPWNASLGWKPVTKLMRRLGDGKVGDTDCVHYSFGDGEQLRDHIWFGKKDGILRQQVLLKQDGKTQWIKTTAIRVEDAARIPDEVFHFKPPEGAKVVDKTKELLDRLDADR
jgi:hypothetical protein